MADHKRFNIHEGTARFALTVMVWVTLNWMAVMLFYKEPPNTMRDLLIAMAGSLSTVFIQQVQYYNKSGIENDRQKDDTIHKAVTTAASIQAAKKTTPEVVLEPGDNIVVGAHDTERQDNSSNT